MMKDRLANFSAVILKGQPIPDDLQKLLQMQVSRVSVKGGYADPLESMGIKIIEPGNTPGLIEHSYLNENDRANPDIMANISAIDEVFNQITFVAEGDDGELFGYWQGAENTPLSKAPIVEFDTEGRFGILPGASLIDAVIGYFVGDNEQKFLELRASFIKYTISVSTSLDQLFVPEYKMNPSELHAALYRTNRIKVGLDG
jgi:hypothetical protein